jgi:hypothetical protein
MPTDDWVFRTCSVALLVAEAFRPLMIGTKKTNAVARTGIQDHEIWYLLRKRRHGTDVGRLHLLTAVKGALDTLGSLPASGHHNFL